MSIRTLPLSFSLLLFAACSNAPPADKTGGPLMVEPSKPTAGKPETQKPEKTAEELKAEADKKAEEKKARDKELRLKLRELEYAKIEQQTGEIDRQTKTMTAQRSLDRARVELQKAQKDLKVFQTVVRPKDLEERRIAHQQAVYHAEHQKDELRELEEMYKAEEFAKTTKELVLKRGRRSMELADRSLAISTTEMKLVEENTLPDKEAELLRKSADAEIELKKAEMEMTKVQIENGLAVRRATDKITDLEQDVADLQAKASKDKS